MSHKIPQPQLFLSINFKYLIYPDTYSLPLCNQATLTTLYIAEVLINTNIFLFLNFYDKFNWGQKAKHLFPEVH